MKAENNDDKSSDLADQVQIVIQHLSYGGGGGTHQDEDHGKSGDENEWVEHHRPSSGFIVPLEIIQRMSRDERDVSRYDRQYTGGNEGKQTEKECGQNIDVISDHEITPVDVVVENGTIFRTREYYKIGKIAVNLMQNL